MADICIIYASEDRAIAEKLHGLLSQQWDTWWDDKIVGRFRQAIEREIPKAACIVAIFSVSSRNKDTFTEELSLGQKHTIEILPVRIDISDPPYPFGAYSYTEMHGWKGEPDHRGFMQLQRRVAEVVPPRAKPHRPTAIARGRVPLPTVFMSVSSHETQLKPDEAVKALRVFGTPTILISAFDLVSRRKPHAIIDELIKYRENGGFVLIDSGNYEKSRLGSKSWKSDDFKEVLAQTPHDWAFCFDVMKPKRNPDRAIEEILQGVERDQAYTTSPVLPIVHAPKCNQGTYSLENLPQIVREVSEKLEPALIAIPERELGAGLIARAKTIQTLREELSKLPFYQPIHILGTGNPWSVAILAAAGADTFDGLEWCRMAIDRGSGRLHHFQHFDFFSWQTLAESSIAREALEDSAIDFAGKVAFHNLDYFASFMKEMLEAITEGNMYAFLVGLTGKDTANQLKQQVPGLFNESLQYPNFV